MAKHGYRVEPDGEVRSEFSELVRLLMKREALDELQAYSAAAVARPDLLKRHDVWSAAILTGKTNDLRHFAPDLVERFNDERRKSENFAAYGPGTPSTRVTSVENVQPPYERGGPEYQSHFLPEADRDSYRAHLQSGMAYYEKTLLLSKVEAERRADGDIKERFYDLWARFHGLAKAQGDYHG